MNRLFVGDNLEILKSLPKESVDLCYIDPPYFTNYNWKNYENQGFKDSKLYFEQLAKKGEKGLSAYLVFMEERFREIHRVLKKTGSFYCQLDYHASHYVKVILDKIFGYNRFQNEIIWRRKNGANCSGKPKKLPTNHDTILVYNKSNKNFFNAIYFPLSDAKKKNYRHNDNDGRGPYCWGKTESTFTKDYRFFNFYDYKTPDKGWLYCHKTMLRFIEEKRLILPKDKNEKLKLKCYLNETKGTPLENVWLDIPYVRGKEKNNWPTQKPLALLERIITLSTNPGDVVLDCFAGSGTTLDAAETLGRQWIGIEQNLDAVEIIKKRMIEKHNYIFETI